MKDAPVCRICGIGLNNYNWYPSLRARNSRRCKTCECNAGIAWRKANPEKSRLASERANRKKGMLPMSDNKECGIFLGVYIAEKVLKHVFKDVEQLPQGNRGYDFICNHGKLIDVKSSCIHEHKSGSQFWTFRISRNKIADHFLCLAFDNRENLNPLYLWLIPGNVLNHLTGATISTSTIDKWDEYRIDVDKVVLCCNDVRSK